MANNFAILCPEGCDELLFPAIDEDQNCLVVPKRSQICGLIMTKGVLPTDWTDPTTYNILNDVVAVDAAKYLVGIGGIDAPDEEVLEGPKDQDIVVNRTYTLDFSVFNLSDAHYDFLRLLQCGDTDFMFWYEGIDGYLYGGPSGICPKSVSPSLPKGSGRTDYDSGNLTITFESLIDPPRTPWAGFPETPSVATVLAYGPVTGGMEAYGTINGGDDYYAPTT